LAGIERWRAGLRWLLALVYFAAGVMHLLRPAAFLAITPPWVPLPALVIMATGICEILGAIGLLLPRWRWWAGVMLALYAVAVFPANIHHAVNGVAVGGTVLGWGYHLPRLLFQPVFVWWALFAGGVVDWPWRSAEPEPRQP
jgi:uncharacterized membrane protein